VAMVLPSMPKGEIVGSMVLALMSTIIGVCAWYCCIFDMLLVLQVLDMMLAEGLV